MSIIVAYILGAWIVSLTVALSAYFAAEYFYI